MDQKHRISVGMSASYLLFQGCIRTLQCFIRYTLSHEVKDLNQPLKRVKFKIVVQFANLTFDHAGSSLISIIVFNTDPISSLGVDLPGRNAERPIFLRI
jgi:hypothetical protein